MEFEINFNRNTSLKDDEFLREKLGAYIVDTGSTKYPPFEILKIEVKDFNHLKELLDIVNKELKSFYSAVIDFNPATIYLDDNV